jgi:hypothetical protein
MFSFIRNYQTTLPIASTIFSFSSATNDSSYHAISSLVFGIFSVTDWVIFIDVQWHLIDVLICISLTNDVARFSYAYLPPIYVLW